MTSLFMTSVANVYDVIFRVLSGRQMVMGSWMHHWPHSIIFSTNVDKKTIKIKNLLHFIQNILSFEGAE